MTLSDKQDKVTLSQSSFVLTGTSPGIATISFVPHGSNNFQSQSEDIEVTITPQHPFLTFNPSTLSYTIPPNDLEARYQDPITLQSQSENQNLTLTIDNLAGPKLSLIHI